jgi:hypothetical protein
MAQSMEMNDAARLGMLWFDQFEWRAADPMHAAA